METKAKRFVNFLQYRDKEFFVFRQSGANSRIGLSFTDHDYSWT